MASNNSNVPTPLSDPVRWWPTGVPQGASVVGGAIATYAALSKFGGVNPRVRAALALGVAGISTTAITTQTILENSVGFNSIDMAYQQNEGQLKEFAATQIKTLSSAQQLEIESAAQMVYPIF
ncbi:hypothetical protein M413DRAFT_32727 [Hebeloma cylindrosporum]|uniref:Uncharacterized protein n=1 Tax=Hebeloma cylindrosporum TaxID=76867 RepID=A0A0C2XB08_HEBCY|nr:hypothetical protein M413DRAFT_32727 [Hebeloma cylindrosporum h7]